MTQLLPPTQVFVGSNGGAPHLIMTESGLTNAFADVPGSWSCVSVADVVAADPDVFIIGYYDGSEAEPKIDFLHNNSLLCELDAVKHADYIGVPFSASTLGPRNGAAAVDIAGAAIHVRTGDNTMNGQSGVDFFVWHIELEPQASTGPWEVSYSPSCASRWTGPRGDGGPYCGPPLPGGSRHGHVRQDLLHQLRNHEHAGQDP